MWYDKNIFQTISIECFIINDKLKKITEFICYYFFIRKIDICENKYFLFKTIYIY